MKTRAGKTILITAIVVVVILFAAIIFFQRYLPPMLEKRMAAELEKVLNEDVADLYTIKVSGTRIHNLLRNISVQEISVTQSGQTLKAHAPDELPPLLFNFTILGFQISTDGLIDIARGRDKIGFRAILFERANAEIWSNPVGKTSDSQDDSSGELSSLIVERLKADSITFSHYSFPDSTLLATARSISLQSKVKWVPELKYRLTQYQLSDYKILAGQIDITPSEDLYSYHILSLSITEEQNQIAIDEIRIKPLYGKKEFQQHLTYQTDRMDVKIAMVEIHAPDISRLINQQIFTAEKLQIGNSEIGVFRDRDLPLDTERRPHMPTRLIRTAPIGFHISQIELNNSSITYSELPENGGTEGVVPFTALSARLSNFTNLEDSLKKDSILTITAGSKMFGEAQLNASFNYNLMDINGGYTARGELKTLDFKAINSALGPLAGIEVEGGKHNHSTFHFSGNDQETTGELTMLYEGLVLELEQDRSKIRQAIVRWAGRNLLYHPSNPANGDRKRIAAIEFERNQSRFVFHYWWQSYLSGIQNTVLRDTANYILSDD